VEESLFSSSWYRVAGMKPRLRSQVQIEHHTYRGRDWYVLQDHSTGRLHRFSAEAYFVIGLMDGTRTLDEIWENACGHLGDDMPTQDEVIRLLAQLHQAEVLQSDIAPDIADLYQRQQQGQRRRVLGYLRSPVALRFPLLRPDRFLERTKSLFCPLFGWVGGVLWCAAVLPALVLVGMHWDELTTNVTDRVLSLQNLALLFLVYPVVKALHEFGHAYAVKRWTGEVREMGIMLLVFMPIPYVDASAASAYPEKRARMLVGAAGILVELFLAALAVFAWVNVEPGTVRAIAFNVMLLSGVSTLAFNGNPLLRFDAYYILSDWLEIPNLGTRANAYVGYLLKRYLLGMSEARSPVSAPGEAPWLAFYALASFASRVSIMVAIGLFVARKFFAVGILIAMWALFGVFVMPLIKVIGQVFTDVQLQRKRARILLAGGAVLAVLAAFLLAMPVSLFTMAEGVVWVPEPSQVHAGANGFVVEMVAAPGQEVQRGDLLMRCENAELVSRVKILEARLREVEARHRALSTEDRTAAEILKEEVDKVKAELAQNRERSEELLIRSPAAGVFLLPDAQNLPGRFVRRGTPLGYVVDFSQIASRVIVSQFDVDQVRNHLQRIEARLAGAIDQRVEARLVREVPAASNDLPSLALSLEGGGSVALDPRQQQNPRTFERFFQFELALPGIAVDRVGERVYVRFEHEPEPLAFRWYRAIRRLLLNKFAV